MLCNKLYMFFSYCLLDTSTSVKLILALWLDSAYINTYMILNVCFAKILLIIRYSLRRTQSLLFGLSEPVLQICYGIVSTQFFWLIYAG